MENYNQNKDPKYLVGYFYFIYNRFYLPYCIENKLEPVKDDSLWDLLEQTAFMTWFKENVTDDMKNSVSKIVKEEIEKNSNFVWNSKFNDVSL